MPKRKAGNAAAVPSGYSVVSGNADGASWKPEVGDELVGVVVGKKTLDAKAVGRQNAKKGDKVVLVSIANDDGEIFAVWESAALREFAARVKVKDKVYLRFDGVKKIGKKRFNQITAAIKK